MSRQDEVAIDLEAAAADLERFIAGCPDREWTASTTAEGWTRAAVAAHCAMGNTVALGWLCQMVAWRPVRETPETHNASNAAEAARHRDAEKGAVVDALRRTTARTAGFLRSLTDEELQRAAYFGLAGREVTVDQFLGNFGRHVRAHLDSLRAR